ncbi:pyruvate formate lyase activating enzyme [Erysipelotrichaceae bacterium]|nr:pyruvate formate lyase activating enzyme [Erysipelotrichaceae bacterium]
MSSKTGIVFDIQRFSVNDGPGIRTTVFLKGCHLRCTWCHNPESISPKVQLNYDAKKCIRCGDCVAHVQGDGLEIIDDELIIDWKKHDENIELVSVCPSKAFGQYGENYTVEEVLDVVMKDEKYYETSGGGITFSGGEALVQAEFVQALAEKSKALGLHTTLDASGFNHGEKMLKILPYIDTILLDYKITDASKFARYLGATIDLYPLLNILENQKKQVVLRCPIIPTVNDTSEHLAQISKFTQEYDCIAYTDILAYHNMKKNKQFKYVHNT